MKIERSNNNYFYEIILCILCIINLVNEYFPIFEILL